MTRSDRRDFVFRIGVLAIAISTAGCGTNGDDESEDGTDSSENESANSDQGGDDEAETAERGDPEDETEDQDNEGNRSDEEREENGDGEPEDESDEPDGDENEIDQEDTTEIDQHLQDAPNYDGTVEDRTESGTVNIEVGDPNTGSTYRFEPPAVEIETGTVVSWDWVDEEAHSVTHSNGDDFDSGVDAELEFEYTFEETGTYLYECVPHRAFGEVGAIVVV